jgi:hypothetical protein
LHPGFFSCIGFAWAQTKYRNLSQDALLHFPSLSAIAGHFKPLKRAKPVKPVENVRKFRGFPAGLLQAAVGIRAFCGFPRTRHFPSGQSSIRFYPQILPETQKNNQ